ncbi:hypothetical protein ACJX0J_020277, partial [Zea mays]
MGSILAVTQANVVEASVNLSLHYCETTKSYMIAISFAHTSRSIANIDRWWCLLILALFLLIKLTTVFLYFIKLRNNEHYFNELAITFI